MKNYLFAAFVTLGFIGKAQCDACNLEGETDYCHIDESFEGYCAAFKDGASTFQLVTGKKTRTIPLNMTPDYKYLLQIVDNKKLKISAKDVLFIEAATHAWPVESRKVGYTIDESGLGIKVIAEGTGDLPAEGEKVSVHYTGWLLDGTKFDSSYDRNQPFSFALGQGRVIKGWDIGVSKLKKGSKAFLKIPANLGYGARGAGRAIPPNATLIFEIEVLETDAE